MEEQTQYKLAPLLDQGQPQERAIVEIRVPQHRPGQEYFTDFENQSGYIEWEGASYNFVKKKMVGTDVIFTCIPDEGREQLKDMRYDLTTLYTVFPGTENTPEKQRTTTARSGPSDYDDQLFLSALRPVAVIAVTAGGNCITTLPRIFRNVPHSPPEC